MEKREYGTNPTLECKHDSNEAVNKQLRYTQIKTILKKSPKTAREIAYAMYKKGYVSEVDRNFASPRLTELAEKGEVEPIGKKLCPFSGRKVTVWALKEQG